MNKNKNSTGIVIGVLIFLISVVVGSLIMLLYNNSEEQQSDDPYLAIEELDLEYNYPDNHLQVVKDYYTIYSYLYSGECDLDKIEEVITKQRLLFAEELNEYNPYEAQVNNVISEITQMNDMGVYFIDYDINRDVISEGEITKADVYVTEYLSGLVTNYKKYTLIKEAGDWKIFAWEYVSEDKINQLKESN